MLAAKALLAFLFLVMIYPVTLTYQDAIWREEEESYTKVIEIMFSEIQLDHKQQYEQREIIDINGVELAGLSIQNQCESKK
jgi:hypothetical protein